MDPTSPKRQNGLRLHVRPEASPEAIPEAPGGPGAAPAAHLPGTLDPAGGVVLRVELRHLELGSLAAARCGSLGLEVKLGGTGVAPSHPGDRAYKVQRSMGQKPREHIQKVSRERASNDLASSVLKRRQQTRKCSQLISRNALCSFHQPAFDVFFFR